jgi:hypothetical protein
MSVVQLIQLCFIRLKHGKEFRFKNSYDQFIRILYLDRPRAICLGCLGCLGAKKIRKADALEIVKLLTEGKVML